MHIRPVLPASSARSSRPYQTVHPTESRHALLEHPLSYGYREVDAQRAPNAPLQSNRWPTDQQPPTRSELSRRTMPASCAQLPFATESDFLPVRPPAFPPARNVNFQQAEQQQRLPRAPESEQSFALPSAEGPSATYRSCSPEFAESLHEGGWPAEQMNQRPSKYASVNPHFRQGPCAQASSRISSPLEGQGKPYASVTATPRFSRQPNYTSPQTVRRRIIERPPALGSERGHMRAVSTGLPINAPHYAVTPARETFSRELMAEESVTLSCDQEPPLPRYPPARELPPEYRAPPLLPPPADEAEAREHLWTRRGLDSHVGREPVLYSERPCVGTGGRVEPAPSARHQQRYLSSREDEATDSHWRPFPREPVSDQRLRSLDPEALLGLYARDAEAKIQRCLGPDFSQKMLGAAWLESHFANVKSEYRQGQILPADRFISHLLTFFTERYASEQETCVALFSWRLLLAMSSQFRVQAEGKRQHRSLGRSFRAALKQRGEGLLREIRAAVVRCLVEAGNDAINQAFFRSAHRTTFDTRPYHKTSSSQRSWSSLLTACTQPFPREEGKVNGRERGVSQVEAWKKIVSSWQRWAKTPKLYGDDRSKLATLQWHLTKFAYEQGKEVLLPKYDASSCSECLGVPDLRKKEIFERTMPDLDLLNKYLESTNIGIPELTEVDIQELARIKLTLPPNLHSDNAWEGWLGLTCA